MIKVSEKYIRENSSKFVFKTKSFISKPDFFLALESSDEYMEEQLDCDHTLESDDPELNGNAVFGSNCYVKCKEAFFDEISQIWKKKSKLLTTNLVLRKQENDFFI